MELKDRGLRWAFDWSDTTGADILKGIAEGIQMSDQLTLPTTAIQDLPARLRMVYETWQNGTDLRAILPKNSFYRYRRQLLPHGVDIAIRQPYEDRSNVVPLVRVLEAVPATLPDWVYGTSLLLGPADLDEARRKFRQRRASV
jgi:II/X family phage/plasmid replication protein